MQAESKLPNSTLPRIPKHDLKTVSDELVMDLVKTLGQISDFNKNSEIIPALDQEDSLLNDSSSFFDFSMQSDEISIINDIENIKSKNSELRKTVKNAVQCFKQTSKAFLSRSILESEKKNLLLTELEHIKQVLFSLSQDNNELIHKIHEQVDSVQAEIHNSIQVLGPELDLQDSETLTKKLQDLDQSLGKISCEEESKNQSCHCIVA